MRIEIIRQWPKDNYIIGRMFINGSFFCHTLEPPIGRKEHPAIPLGTYSAKLYPSYKFKGLRPILLNVPGRSGILIHEGNTVKDTQGCILVGNNTQVGKVLNSRVTLNKLLSIFENSSSSGDPITVSIKSASH